MRNYHRGTHICSKFVKARRYSIKHRRKNVFDEINFISWQFPVNEISQHEDIIKKNQFSCRLRAARLPRKATSTHIGARNHSRFSILINYGRYNIYNPLFSIKYSLPIALARLQRRRRDKQLRVGARLSGTLNLQVNWQKEENKNKFICWKIKWDNFTKILAQLCRNTGYPTWWVVYAVACAENINSIYRKSDSRHLSLFRSSKVIKVVLYQRLHPGVGSTSTDIDLLTDLWLLFMTARNKMLANSRNRQWVSRKLLNFYFVVSSFIGPIGVAYIPAHHARELKMKFRGFRAFSSKFCKHFSI